MYCINCGKSIPEFSKFCSHCGLSQTNAEPSINEKIADIIIETEILKQNIDEHQASMNLAFLKKCTGWYLAWVMIHLSLLLIFSDSIFAEKYSVDPFWPFGHEFQSSTSLSDYDIREFLVYTLFPLFLLVIISLIVPPRQLKTISDSNKTIINKTPVKPEVVANNSDDFNTIAVLVAILIMVMLLLIGVKS